MISSVSMALTNIYVSSRGFSLKFHGTPNLMCPKWSALFFPQLACLAPAPSSILDHAVSAQAVSLTRTLSVILIHSLPRPPCLMSHKRFYWKIIHNTHLLFPLRHVFQIWILIPSLFACLWSAPHLLSEPVHLVSPFHQPLTFYSILWSVVN